MLDQPSKENQVVTKGAVLLRSFIRLILTRETTQSDKTKGAATLHARGYVFMEVGGWFRGYQRSWVIHPPAAQGKPCTQVLNALSLAFVVLSCESQVVMHGNLACLLAISMMRYSKIESKFQLLIVAYMYHEVDQATMTSKYAVVRGDSAVSCPICSLIQTFRSYCAWFKHASDAQTGRGSAWYKPNCTGLSRGFVVLDTNRLKHSPNSHCQGKHWGARWLSFLCRLW